MQRNKTSDVSLTKLDSMQRTFENSRVAFTLKCPASQAYLLLASQNGRALALEQMTSGGDAWRLTLDLKPGTYRYRYYVTEGHRTSYFSPREGENARREVHMDGMDAVFDVALADLRKSASRPIAANTCRPRCMPASGICSEHHCS